MDSYKNDDDEINIFIFGNWKLKLPYLYHVYERATDMLS